MQLFTNYNDYIETVLLSVLSRKMSTNELELEKV